MIDNYQTTGHKQIAKPSPRGAIFRDESISKIKAKSLIESDAKTTTKNIVVAQEYLKKKGSKIEAPTPSTAQKHSIVSVDSTSKRPSSAINNQLKTQKSKLKTASVIKSILIPYQKATEQALELLSAKQKYSKTFHFPTSEPNTDSTSALQQLLNQHKNPKVNTLFKPILKPSTTAVALLSERSKPKPAKKAVKAKNPSIIARRISLTKNPQALQHRASTSSDQKPTFEKKRASSGSTN